MTRSSNDYACYGSRAMSEEERQAKGERQRIVRDSEALFRSNFEKVAEMPLTWRLTADELLRASRALLPLIEADNRAMNDPSQQAFEPSVVPVYMMLAGFAIENLAKAMIIEGGSFSPTEREGLVKELTSHDLLGLLDDAGVALTEDETYLVERLETFLRWAGRYPIPLTVEASLPRTHPRGGWGPLTNFTSTDVDAIEALVARVSPGHMSIDEGAEHQGQQEPTSNLPGRQAPNRLAVTVVLALVISVVAVALITSRTTSVRVPDLTGLAVDPNLDVVRTSLDTQHLVLGDAVIEECDPLQLPRTVVDQSPAPGTSVPSGAAVAITICR